MFLFAYYISLKTSVHFDRLNVKPQVTLPSLVLYA